jgi:hypothetical protein
VSSEREFLQVESLRDNGLRSRVRKQAAVHDMARDPELDDLRARRIKIRTPLVSEESAIRSLALGAADTLRYVPWLWPPYAYSPL